MKYFFLIAAIWNLLGGINFLFTPEKQAKNMNYPVGNRWESQYIAIMAFIFCAIYAMIFYSQPLGYLTFVPFFAAVYTEFYFNSDSHFRISRIHFVPKD